MQARIRRDGTVWISLEGQLNKTNREEFRGLVDDVINRGSATTVVIDCAHCFFIDSGGLGALVTVTRRLAKARISPFLTGLQEDLRALFELTKLDELFQFYEHRSFKEARTFTLPAFGAVNDEVMSYVATHPETLNHLHWRDFERLLEAIFRNQGFTTELGTGFSDGGIDLRLLRNDNLGAMVTLVQAKGYSANRPIRLEAVQAFCALIDDEHANRGLFVTTSRYLPSARSFANKQGRRIQLSDSMDVARWCKGVIRATR